MSNCPHRKFGVQANVIRIKPDEHVPDSAPVSHYTMDVTVWCEDCKKPFAFVGIPAGLSPYKPMCSVDGLEARIPIGPAGEVSTILDPDDAPAYPGYTVRKTL